jgi:hypothetical protein
MMTSGREKNTLSHHDIEITKWVAKLDEIFRCTILYGHTYDHLNT